MSGSLGITPAASASYIQQIVATDDEEYAMDTYTFNIEDFTIAKSRALHNDTLHLSYTAYTDGDLVATSESRLGDNFSTGSYSTAAMGNLGLGPVVINNPNSKVAFIFQLVNVNNVPDDALSSRLAATADQLAGITAGLAGAGATAEADEAAAASGGAALPIALLMEVFANLRSWLNVDCDGPVTVDQVSGPRYVIDAWADNSLESIRKKRRYFGTDSGTGCGGNSDYELAWSLVHRPTWIVVSENITSDITTHFRAATGIDASEHNGAVHAFGLTKEGVIGHARTFTGQTWTIDELSSLPLAEVPVSSVSFNDRLCVFGVRADGAIAPLQYTIDGASWLPLYGGSTGFVTSEPVALAVFRNRLYLAARNSTTSAIEISSTSDFESWNPWVTVPTPSTIQPLSPISTTTLGGKLFVFGVYRTSKAPAIAVMYNSTSDGIAWSGWDTVEAGAAPHGASADQPLDVTATTFNNRIYLASRWRTEHNGLFPTDYVVQNFSNDGDNWSGWRRVRSDVDLEPASRCGLAAAGSHLYTFTPKNDVNKTEWFVWAY